MILQYWMPLRSLFLSLGLPASLVGPLKALAGALGAGEYLRFLEGGSAWWISAIGVLLLVVRSPRLVAWFTRTAFGERATPQDQLIFRGPRSYQKGEILPDRKADEEQCWARIQKGRFFILEGESGCGKSSLLNVRVIPRVEQHCRVIQARVGEDPFGKLTCAARRIQYRKGEHAFGPEDLAEALTQTAQSPTSAEPNQQPNPILLCIDQFEELFSTVKDDDRVRLACVLREAVRAGRLRLLLAIRSDYRDLLNHLCRDVDPDLEVFVLRNDYRLRAFKQALAQEVLDEMLTPLSQGDAVLQQRFGAFSAALIKELLRPPRDQRLCREDEPTVLPVELQIVGYLLQQRGASSFDARLLQRSGGYAGLLREYVEDVKQEVWLDTGLKGKETLLILQTLTAGDAKGPAQTPESISCAVRLPKERVRRALKVLGEKYVVKFWLPEGENGANGEVDRYELMHDRIARILVESPEPEAQRTRDFRERLHYLVERHEKQSAATISSAPPSPLQRIAKLFHQPAPAFESLRLLPYATDPKGRSLLTLSLRGFSARLAVLLTIALALYWVTFTDRYQIWRIVRDAPVAEASRATPDRVREWATSLVLSGRFSQATDAISNVTVQERAYGFREMAEALAETGHFQESLRFFDEALRSAAEIEWANDRAEMLREIAEAFAVAGRFEEALEAAERIKSPARRAYSFARVGVVLARTGTTDGVSRAFEAALGAAEQTRWASYERAEAFARIAEALIEAERVEEAIEVTQRAFQEAMRPGPTIRWTGDRADMLRKIAVMLAGAGRLEQALDAAARIGADDRDDTLREIAVALAGAGYFEEAQGVAAKIDDAYRRGRARRQIAEALAVAGRVEEAQAVFNEELVVAGKIDHTLVRAAVAFEIAVALARFPRLDGDQRAFEEALEAAERIELVDDREPALGEIAVWLTGVGRFEEAQGVAAKIEGVFGRARALRQIAEALAVAGRIEEAQSAFNEALAVAGKVSRSGARTAAFREIAVALARFPRLDGSQRAFDEAQRAAGRIEQPDERDRAFREISESLAGAKAFEEALGTAVRVEDAYQRVSTLSRIAELLEEAGRKQFAVEVLNDAISAVAQMESRGSRSPLLARVAKVLTRLHMYRRSRLIADDCLAGERLSVYAVMLKEYTNQNRDQFGAAEQP